MNEVDSRLLDNIINKLKQNKKLLVIGAVALIFLLLISYNYFQTNKDSATIENAQKIEEAKRIISKVGKLTVLPQDEEPTMATVSDKSKLSDQKFFNAAENGDKVLIYSKAQKAILYRESINKIIEIAAINIPPIDNAPVTESTSSSTLNPSSTGTPTPEN